MNQYTAESYPKKNNNEQNPRNKKHKYRKKTEVIHRPAKGQGVKIFFAGKSQLKNDKILSLFIF